MRKEEKSGALAVRVESHASVIDTGPECDRNSWRKCSQSLGKRKAERSSVSQSAKDVFRELSKDSGHLSALFPHLQNVILRTDWILILNFLDEDTKDETNQITLQNRDFMLYVCYLKRSISLFFFNYTRVLLSQLN